MTKLPDLHSMDPDEWFSAMADLWERFREEIADALDAEDDPQAVVERLQPKFEPYVYDLDDDMSAEQLWADVDGDKLLVGEVNNPVSVTWRDDGEFWWYEGRKYDGSQPVRKRHTSIAEAALDTMIIGMDDAVAEQSREAKRSREFAESYLRRLESKLDDGDPTAAQLRDALVDYLTSCSTDRSVVELVDNSPGEHRTRLQLKHDEKIVGEVLAVDPGESIEWDDLSDQFDVGKSSAVSIATDHLRFTGLMAGSWGQTYELPSPIRRDDDEKFNREAMGIFYALRAAMAAGS